MRREHWLGMLVLSLGMWTTPAQASGKKVYPPPVKYLPSFVPQPPGPDMIGDPGMPPGPLASNQPGTTVDVPPATGKPARLAPPQWNGGCEECARQRPEWSNRSYGHWYPGRGAANCVSRIYYNCFEPICGTDGCLMPMGCSNFHLEFLFAFGSCRQYFGTGTAAPASLIPPPR